MDIFRISVISLLIVIEVTLISVGNELKRFNEQENKTEIHHVFKVHEMSCTITAYTNRPCETNEDDFTATMEKPVQGKTCAVSRDLIHWLGGRIYIEGIGVRRVNDLMNKRFDATVDLYMEKVNDAELFGKVTKRVVFLGG